MNQFKKWNIYIKERSPLPALMIISAAAGITPLAILKTFDLKVLVGSLIFTTLMLIQMRLGDEIKDFEKDKIIHPNRPLPRGLLKIDEVTKALYAIFLFTLLAGLVFSLSVSILGGLALALTTVFAWLMFKEFFIGQSLNKEPMTYALSHQIIVFPLYAWAGLCYDQELMKNSIFIGWLIASFGASFTFEIGRKLDPNAHQLAGTYAHHYGRPLTILFMMILVFVSGYGAFRADFFYLCLPVLSLVFASLILYLIKPKLFKIVEGTTVLSSLLIMWAPTIQWVKTMWGK